jgi:hypothetical protein
VGRRTPMISLVSMVAWQLVMWRGRPRRKWNSWITVILLNLCYRMSAQALAVKSID